MMGARQSEAMKRAKDLVLNQGMSAYMAAQIVGLSKSAIYMSKWYKDYKNEKAA